jgi:hypothetical protein
MSIAQFTRLERGRLRNRHAGHLTGRPVVSGPVTPLGASRVK